MVTIAALGLVVSLIGTVVAWQLVTDLNRGVGQSLELTAEVLLTVDESFDIADDALVILLEGVTEAEGAVRSLSASMREGESALRSASALAGGDVADALESVEQTLPAVQTAAEAIDETLATLDALPLGLSYSPGRPLGETIAELRAELGDLPDELRQQAEDVERTSQELTAATEGTEATADSLADLEDRLTDASELIGSYALRTGEARALVDEQRDVLATTATRARLTVLAFGLMFALSQFVPLYLGLGLLGTAGVTRDPDIA